jgi:hypothetical protein
MGLFKGTYSKGCLTLFGCSIFCAAFYLVLYLRFVNQHHRNVVANWVNTPAFNALQGAAIGLQLNLCLAGGAGEYFQQILTDWHRCGPHIAVPWAYPGALEEAFRKGKAYHKTVSRRQRQEEVHFPFLICHLPFSIDEPSSLKMPNEN